MTSRDVSSCRLQQAMAKIVWWLGRAESRAAMLGDAGRDMSPIDEHLVRTILANGPVRITDLAVWQGVDKSTITPQVRRLEQRGLVKRNPDPGDGRVALLTVTTKGRRTCARIDATATDFISEALREWPEKDREAFATLFSRFAENLTGVLDQR